MTLIGVDYSTGPLTAAQCRAHGIAFVCRYVSNGATGWNRSKTAKQAEVDDFRANGIGIVIVYEGDINDALGGYAQGVTNARLADQQVRALGLTGCPIYLAVDFDAVPAQLPLVAAYLDGAASVLGLPRTGGYGSHRTVTHLFNGGHITYGWAADAWGGQLDPRAHLTQRGGGTVDGVSVDWDYTVSSDTDYGQHRGGSPVVAQQVGILEWIARNVRTP